MSSKYKFVNPESVYFVTARVLDWVAVFTRNLYRDILLDSFRFCQKNHGLQIHACELIPNHFQMICPFTIGHESRLTFKSIKNFTLIKIKNAILNNSKESH